MTVLLLTSCGLTPEKTALRFAKLKGDLNLKTCGLIYNAADSPNSKFINLAKQQLSAAGMNVTLLDARFMDSQRYDMLYIAGGNTFTLLDDVKRGVGINKLKQIILESKLTIGVSAGAILLSPTIRIASEIQPDDNKRGVSDFTSLGVLPHEILPHYSDTLKDELAAYQAKHRTEVLTCADDEYIEIIQTRH